MRQNVYRLAVPLLLVSAIVAACGGGGLSSVSTSSLTKAQFIKKSDAICTRTNKEQLAAVGKVTKENAGKKMDRSQEEEILAVGIPPVQKEAEEIAALGAPSGDEESVAAIVHGLEEGVKTVEESPSGKTLESAFTEVNKLSAAYGLKSCAEAP